jgi:hypothetical protein
MLLMQSKAFWRIQNIPLTLYPSSRDSNKQTQWSLVHKRTIPAERPPFIDEI